MELLSCDVALIAGSGQLPRLILKQMRAQGLRPLLIDIADRKAAGPSAADLAALATVHYSMLPIELPKALKKMKQHGVKEVTMAGGVSHKLLLNLRPWHMSIGLLRLWWSLSDTRADTVLKAVAHYCDKGGVPVVHSLKYLASYVLRCCSGNESGAWGSSSKSALRRDRDVLLGIVAAKTLGAIDVGQSVVVKRGTVIALEGVEGTDGCLDRAIEIGSQGAILVKMAKPLQDFRFDVPTVGEETFRRLKKGRFRALVVESGSTLCTDPLALEALQQAGIELIIADEKLIELAFATYHPLLGELLLKSSHQSRSDEAPHIGQCPHKSTD